MKKSFLLITLFLALFFSIECYGKSLSNVEALAKQGDAAAQCAMGDIYFDDEQVSQNKQEAFKWFKKSAEQNYT